MKGLFHSMASLVMVLFGLSATLTATAQTAEQATTQVVGKEGTVIRFDKSTCHGLFSNGASASDKTDQPFGLMRHDISPVQLFLSNKVQMQEFGLLGDVANGFRFDKNNNRFYLETNYEQDNNTPHFAIVAPKGFRFLQFQWDIDGSSSKENLTMQQVVFDSEGNSTLVGDVFTVDKSSNAQVWTVPLANGSNLIYFKVTAPETGSKLCINSLTLTYAIDQPYEGQLPSAQGTTEVSTGVLNLGKFSYNRDGYFSFNKDYFTDFQSAGIHFGNESGVEDVTTTVDIASATTNGGQYYVAASNGDYYVEAPKKFRVVGATLNFLRSNSEVEEVLQYSAKEETSITSGNQYVIGDGNGHFLNYYAQGGGWTQGVTTTDVGTVTQWTLSRVSTNSNTYYISYTDPKDGVLYYLTYSSNSKLWVVTSTRANAYRFSYSSDKGLYYTSDRTTYYLTYNSGWKRETEVYAPSKLMVVESSVAVEAKSFTGGDFTATAYGRNGEEVAQEVALTESASSASVELDDFNNDAVRFSISGLKEGETALYNVNLRLLPLNPELQNLSVGSKFVDEEKTVVFENTTSFTSVNYNFNDGEAVTIVVPGNVAKDGDDCAVEFLKADNEEKTMWYTDGSKENNTASTGGYSNFFLVNSEADKGTGDDVELNRELGKGYQPGARTSSGKVGQKSLDFTNIKDIYDASFKEDYDGNEYLVENDFKKSEAEYAAATVTVCSDKANIDANTKEFYIYTADQPTFQILPEGTGSKHIDFRYFTLKVQCVRQVEEPVVTLVPIYTETLKSANRDGKISSDANTLDTKHTFYGVKVTATIANDASTTNGIYGYLISKSIEDAIVAELKKQEVNGVGYYGFGEDNMLRGMLYLDISELRGTDEERFDSIYFFKNVADNFLFFVPEGYSSLVGTTNVVEKKSDGTYESCKNVVVRDQQPFFSPYDFNTGRFIVTYEREGTVAGQSVKAKVKNMAAVLPFDVNLDGNGHLKLASDVVDNTVTYHTITGSGEVTSNLIGDPNHALTYAVVADPATGLTKADANVPYYITTTNEGFTYKIMGAQFHKTAEVDATADKQSVELTRTNGTWTAIGTFSGVQPMKDDQLWYFSKDFFWKSGALKTLNNVNVRPFRAYFETTDKTDATQAKVVFDDRDIVSTAIGSVASTASSLQVATGHGFISLTAGSATQVAVYTVAGQLVANASLADGETRRVSLPQGVYMVNHVKVVVK